MNNKIRTAIHCGEFIGAYALSEKIPEDILLKQWNKAAVGVVLVGAGVMLKENQYGNHVLAAGLGVAFNGLMDGFGFEKY